MKRQIITIHGGDPQFSYKSYIAYLKKAKINWNSIRTGKWGWKESVQKELGPAFEVISPRMPNSLNAKYLEWDIWFRKIIPHMNKEVVLVGGSLGAIFLAKYLSENKFPKKIRGLFLIAPPFKGNGPKDSMADFILPKNTSRLEKYGDKIHLYHSTDDTVVVSKDFNRYLEVLPKAKVRIFKDRGHSFGNRFPELVKDIKALYK